MSPDLDAELSNASQGDADAQFAIAEAYRTGKGVSEDFVEALRWYRAAAEQGNVSAQNNLGTMYLSGMGTDKDPKAAAYWYRQASEQGEMVAQFNLAMRYLHGQGVEQSDTEAAHWFLQSAEQGHTEAIGEMGTMYRFGRGVPLNIVTAARYHTEAAMDGDVTSMGNLLAYQKEIEQAALDGSAVAALCLAKMYEKGVPMAKDLVRAKAWLDCARSHCDRNEDPDLYDEVDDMEWMLNLVSEVDKQRSGELLKESAHRAGAELIVGSNENAPSVAGCLPTLAPTSPEQKADNQGNLQAARPSIELRSPWDGASAWATILEDGCIQLELYDHSKQAESCFGNDVAWDYTIHPDAKPRLTDALSKSTGQAVAGDKAILSALAQAFEHIHAIRDWLKQEEIPFKESFNSWA